MRRLALLLALAAGCASVRPLPSAHRPTPHVVRVAIDADLADYRGLVEAGVAILARAGVAVAVLPRGRDALADVYIRHGDAPGVCAWAGLFTAPSRIELDPVCITGGLSWRAVTAHEVMHYLGCQHIPAARGPALMNPRVPLPPLPEDCDPFVHVCADTDEQLSVTALDRAELVRVGALPPR